MTGGCTVAVGGGTAAFNISVQRKETYDEVKGEVELTNMAAGTHQAWIIHHTVP